MNLRLWAAAMGFAVMMAFGASPAAASSITYYVNATAGSTTFNGSITTDGTLGVLAETNITGWNLGIDFGSPIGTLTLNNSTPGDEVIVAGTSLTATASQLLFNFASAANDGLEFAYANYPQFAAFWVSAGNPYGPASASGYLADPNGTAQIFSTSQSLAVLPIASTPLPASLPLLGTGLAVVGLIGWRSSRKKAALRASA